ncbi:MAG: hypothetical protein ACYC9Z_02560 [Casimicrobiaceae bacterium]
MASRKSNGKLGWGFFAVVSVTLLSACATPGTGGTATKAPAADAVQWKEVTRIEGGNVVQYRVPVTQSVPNDMNLREFDPGSQPQAAAGTPVPSPNAQKFTATTPVAPARAQVAQGELPWAKSAAGVPAASPSTRTADAGQAAVAVPPAGATNLSQEAETELGKAEIAVRDAQSRYETARAALERAREAAGAGDGASAIKFARTAVSLSQPGR